jgi:flagellar biosynthesis activator protein FlaF
MYQSLYTEIAADNADAIRDSERRAFEHATALLKSAQDRGPQSREVVEALHFVGRLWGILMEDLANEGNDLPESLRASLISIGIWMLRRVEDVRQGRSDDLRAMIDVSQSISRGLGMRRNADSP